MLKAPIHELAWRDRDVTESNCMRLAFSVFAAICTHTLYRVLMAHNFAGHADRTAEAKFGLDLGSAILMTSVS